MFVAAWWDMKEITSKLVSETCYFAVDSSTVVDCRHHMWVEFVVCFHPCSKRSSPCSPVFLPPQKPTLLNILIQNWTQWTKSLFVGSATANSHLFVYLFIYLFIYCYRDR